MKKILIIDDDVVFQKTMRAKLESCSYAVAQAFDGEEGLTKVTSENPDLMLLDIMMPKLNGLEFLKKLHQDKDVPNIPILITSNMSTTEKIGEGLSLGIRGYIIKSDETLDTIVAEVQNILKE